MADMPLWLNFIVAFMIMNILLVGMAYMTYYERKVLAAMQDRMGPMRTGPKGLLQPLADGVKLLGKEDLIPAAADKWVFWFAPLIVFVTAVVGVAVIPFGGTIHVFGQDINLFITDLNVGALFVLAFGSIGVYGIILGAYASANRYSLAGRSPVGRAGDLVRDHPRPFSGRHLHPDRLAEPARNRSSRNRARSASSAWTSATGTSSPNRSPSSSS